MNIIIDILFNSAMNATAAIPFMCIFIKLSLWHSNNFAGNY